MSTPRAPRTCHLVISISLSSTTEVFHHLSTNISSLTRIPNGETGAREKYVLWQLSLLAAYRIRRSISPSTYSAPPLSSISNLRTGYENQALRSYKIFRHLRRTGVIESGTRFQVSLPTPLIAVTCGVHAKYQADVEPLYEAALVAALAHIQEFTPSEDLAVQWDVALEFAFLEGSES